MSTKNINLSIKSYLDFSQILEKYRGNHEVNRAFALQHKKIQKNPIKLLLTWSSIHQFRLTDEPNSKNYLSYLSSLTSILGLLFFIIGFSVGLGLLSYSGEAPVNIIYYLLVASFLPLLGILFSLFSMITNGKLSTLFHHLFPLHWIEKILALLPSKKNLKLSDIKISTNLSKWLFIERIQLLSLLFSIGLLLSLLLMVIIKDIAFGWSTTLQISPEGFQSILSSIATPWKSLIPSALPSLELVEMSHYFRLGEKLDEQMIHNANRLGAWWKFLAMTTIFYAITLRLILWLLSRYGFRKQLKRDLLSLEGVHQLLQEFETSYISTEAPKEEKHLKITPQHQEPTAHNRLTTYHHIFAWNFSMDELLLIKDNKKIEAQSIFTVGGNSSFTEDEKKAKEAQKTTLLFVKAWEPPTMDFIDFLELLIENKNLNEIQIYPLGTVRQYYKSNTKDISIWRRKIQGIQSKKVLVIDDEQ